MVPHETIAVEAFPLTPNGKVDRTKLLSMEGRLPAAAPLAEAQSGLESDLAKLWAKALGRPAVDRNANFFDLGGTSLLMIRLHAEIRAALKADIAVTDLFANPSISELARFMEGRGKTVAAVNQAQLRGARQREMLGRLRHVALKTTE
jgi:aryl carrier-like protein